MAEMNFSDLGALISMLQSNPEMLKMLSSIIGAGSQQRQEPPKQDVPKAAPNADAFASIMSMLSGQRSPDEKPCNTSNPSKEPNPMSVFGTSEEIKNRIALLNAVRPYLTESRKERLEAVIKLLRLAELGGLSRLLNA